MVHPIFLLAKFAPNLLQLIGFAEAYGWNRVYRRLCEGTKFVGGMTRQQQAQIRMMLKESLRFPVRSYDLLRNHEMVSFASQYATRIVEEKNLRVPDFMVSAASFFLKRTKLGKIHDILEKGSAKKSR